MLFCVLAPVPPTFWLAPLLGSATEMPITPELPPRPRLGLTDCKLRIVLPVITELTPFRVEIPTTWLAALVELLTIPLEEVLPPMMLPEMVKLTGGGLVLELLVTII